MMAPLLGIEARLASALAEAPSRIPVLVGPCGSGRTRALQRVRDGSPPGSCHYIDVERVMSSPEQFFGRVTSESPLDWPAPARPPDGPRDAYNRTLAYFTTARARDGGPATLLLDEALELRLFESFPGLSDVMEETLQSLSASGNRFVLATKYETRTLRALRKAPDRYPRGARRAGGGIGRRGGPPAAARHPFRPGRGLGARHRRADRRPGRLRRGHRRRPRRAAGA